MQKVEPRANQRKTTKMLKNVEAKILTNVNIKI